jgi:hypothetical protein
MIHATYEDMKEAIENDTKFFALREVVDLQEVADKKAMKRLAKFSLRA